jgi:hypothetical protein
LGVLEEAVTVPIGRQINQRFDLKARQALYRRDGTWYHAISDEGYPAILCDRSGYIRIKSRSALLRMDRWNWIQVRKQIHVPKGISKLPTYRPFPTRAIVANGRLVQGRHSNGVRKMSRYREGVSQQLLIEMKGRNSKLRADAVREYGAGCQVCGFDFGRFYGGLGSGFVEVHHKRPLSTARNERLTKLNDVAVVCANCHRMLHRLRGKFLDVDALRKQMPSESLKVFQRNR